MWSEEINKKIEEAEGSNHHAYNDQAWDKMELLLDKHLPQKRKKRRFILLLLPLLLAGGTIFFINQQKRTNNTSITKQETKIVNPTPTSDKPTGNTGNQTTSSKEVTNQTSTEEITLKNTLPGTSVQNPSAPDRQQISSGEIKTSRYELDDKRTSQSFVRKNIPSKKERTRGNDVNNIVSERTVMADLPVPLDNSVVNNNTDPVKTNTADPVLIDSSTTPKTIAAADTKQKDTTQAEITKTKVKDPKSKTSTGSKFSLNLSAGPDVSAVGVDNPGKIDMLYGVGVGYALSKRLTIRTGFFAVSKIYTADSGDYKTTYPIHKLNKIDANCLVYEIPVTLVYNFPSVKKHNWFVAGGLSSYLMKKETYGYHYENAWGQPQYYKRSYENENKHLFSVINLSGGYQYHFTDRFSIMAEPYIKIPTSGVGEGKVKLNSAGMLFTVGFKPFVRKN
jgi:hypothetical protein